MRPAKLSRLLPGVPAALLCPSGEHGASRQLLPPPQDPAAGRMYPPLQSALQPMQRRPGPSRAAREARKSWFCSLPPSVGIRCRHGSLLVPVDAALLLQGQNESAKLLFSTTMSKEAGPAKDRLWNVTVEARSWAVDDAEKAATLF